jgi:hypothetical protein
LVETDRILDQALRVLPLQWFVIRKEIPAPRKILLRLLVVTAMDCIVRPLEQSAFTIQYKLS